MGSHHETFYTQAHLNFFMRGVVRLRPMTFHLSRPLTVGTPLRKTMHNRLPTRNSLSTLLTLRGTIETRHEVIQRRKKSLMAQKKETRTQLSQEYQQQIDNVFLQYHQIAEQLHNSTDQAQVETILTNITGLPMPAQLALVKTLAREHTTDAADVLTAIYTLAIHKDVRKEARRGLIHLEATKTYARWQSPIVQTLAIQLQQNESPRFWQGLVSQSRDQGEIQLILCWEQGYDYSEVHVMMFTLNYWYTGIADVLVKTLSKRRLDQFIDKVRADLPDDVTLVDCTLAEGKRLIEEALSVNQWRDRAPAKSYRYQLPVINKHILQMSDLDEDRGHTFINPELEEQEVIVNFLGAWLFGDYGLAYDLLTHDSSLHADLSRDEWIAHHRLWHQEAHPTRLKLRFVHERQKGQSALWLPPSVTSGPPSQKNMEVGWSAELSDTPLSGTLKEMPMATAINKETGRHWFWTTYTLVHTNGVWRIQHSIDEGLALQSLSIPELQSRIKAYQGIVEELVKQQQASNAEEAQDDVFRHFLQMVYFYDVLLTRLPLNYEVHEEAYAHVQLLEDFEQLIVYLDFMVQRFPEQRTKSLRQLSLSLMHLARQYDQQKMPERFKHLMKRAEETVQQAIVIDDDATDHMIYGELLIRTGELDKAEATLHIARKKQPTDTIETVIEEGLGDIAMQREQPSEAIPHYRHIVESNPQYPSIWFNLGLAHRQLGELAEAEQCYRQAIQTNPRDSRAPRELAGIYIKGGQLDQARTLIEQTIQFDPESAHLHASLALILFQQGNHRAAQQALQEAEQIDPELEIVQALRQHIPSSKRK